MKLFRNREVFIITILMLAVTAGASLFIYTQDSSLCWIVFSLGILLTALHLLSNQLRYREIAKLSLNIDRLLHDDSRMTIGDYCEGELAVLHSEIYKLTVKLREQSGLLQEEKLRLVDFLADVSHQIRTPLTSMNLVVSLLEKQDLTYQRRRELTRELFELLTRIDWLITSLLKISKLDAGTIKFRNETITLSDLIIKASRPVQIPIELRGQELVIESEGSFTGDIAWSCEAIGNILKNCMEHTPEGGTIKVCAEENALYSEIIITDTGSGISPEDLPHVFERFYKGKDSGESSFGIGLALARMIALGQNGTLKAESPAGGGAKFTMRFYKGTV